MKVISYLWEGIPKSKRKSIFSNSIKSFGDIYKLLHTDAPLTSVFSTEFSKELTDILDDENSDEESESDAE